MTGSQPTVWTLLADPSVLRAAWMRIDEWYRSGNLAPQPELADWRLDPYRHLRALRKSLLEEEWEPSKWPQVPHPKKGRRLRHYLQPTVRDQVVFMAYMVLLGPLLDAVMPPFSFGNRWYRPILWERRRPSPGWRVLPYQLFSNRSYLPYARSHGLFRRVAHWTVARMTGSEVPQTGEAGPIPHPDDYGDVLPEFVRPEWWAKGDGHGQECGHRAGFDLPSRRSSGEEFVIEVIGRAGPEPVELTDNEWARVDNLRSHGCPYVVCRYATTGHKFRASRIRSTGCSPPPGSVVIPKHGVQAVAWGGES